MKNILVTGGSGFVGSHLVEYLLKKREVKVVVFDLLANTTKNHSKANVNFVNGDICSEKEVENLFKTYGPFDVVYHLAAAMPDKSFSNNMLWKINVMGTKNLIQQSVETHVKSFIFTSSNVSYGVPNTFPVTEETPLLPIEIYGKSKMQAEKELGLFKGKINIQIFRCPVISGLGRLGLQAILFEFISENKNVYLLGNGSNTYQFIDVIDVVSALEKASYKKGFNVYNIGADEVVSLRTIYERVIAYAKSKSKIISLPMTPAIFALSILEKLNISPLGVYQYTMLGRSYVCDTKKIKKQLQWSPTVTNTDTFLNNYKWYVSHKGEFAQVDSKKASSNKSTPKMGILSILKLIS